MKRTVKAGRKGMKWFNKQPLKIRAGIMIALVFAAWQLGPVIAGSGIDIYEGGWEVRSNISSVFVNGAEYTRTSQPQNMIQPWGDQYLEFDVDEPLWGVPNLIVDIGPPREYVVDQYGEWVRAPAGVHFDSIQKPLEDTYYFWDHYVHRYHVRVTAYPDYNPGGLLDDTDGEAAGLALAQEAQLTVRTKFVLDPFINRLIDSFSTEDANYTLDSNKVFAGVMSVKVAGKDSGFVGYLEGTEPEGIGGKTIIAPNGGTLNSYAAFDPDAPSTAMSVPTEILIDVGGTLLPSYKWVPGFLFIGGTMYTYAVYFDYWIEVHSIASAGYNLESGNMDDVILDVDYDQDEGSDPIGEAIAGFGAAVGGFFEWAGAGLSGFLSSIGLGFIMPLVMLLVFVLVGYFVMKRFVFKKATGGAIK
jgi:hypothetical protein